ncbi:MAG: hypothetical protein K1X72_26435 [Pyrinomonadaceae bacterium]|nr:hypothetical protein [Pyrinomonadaceae bacterium]
MTTEKVKNDVEHSSIGEGVKKKATNAISQIKDKTGDFLGEQKNQFSVSLKNIANSLRETSKNLEKTDEKADLEKLTAKFGNNFASQIERFSHYVERTNLKDFSSDVEKFARRKPALFIAGAFALGFIGARILKSTHPLQNFENK